MDAVDCQWEKRKRMEFLLRRKIRSSPPSRRFTGEKAVHSKTLDHLMLFIRIER